MPGNALQVEGDFANCFVHINKDFESVIRKGATERREPTIALHTVIRAEHYHWEQPKLHSTRVFQVCPDVRRRVGGVGERQTAAGAGSGQAKAVTKWMQESSRLPAPAPRPQPTPACPALPALPSFKSLPPFWAAHWSTRRILKTFARETSQLLLESWADPRVSLLVSVTTHAHHHHHRYHRHHHAPARPGLAPPLPPAGSSRQLPSLSPLLVFRSTYYIYKSTASRPSSDYKLLLGAALQSTTQQPTAHPPSRIPHTLLLKFAVGSIAC
ncbi:hypothetical protein E2C01_004978 [Portunus trituberculatus]|uniref:Uncharacterized protein n=1 Tax=Portunus trituberculatus TaxID=210409 RepID=A0A5B7CXV5_PORTR|nr:hypothetical protein [Portunus trituberculatus]